LLEIYFKAQQLALLMNRKFGDFGTLQLNEVGQKSEIIRISF
jgi:hypothetical protein